MRPLLLARVCGLAAGLWLMVATGPGAAETAGAAPLIARSQMLTVDEVRPGMKGVGKSVFSGTRIESFGVTVLGVLRRVDFGGDIILVRIDSGPPVARGYGVVGGMSGSPIYIGGKLIGALAYTWPFSKQPIAGVTPIAQMLEAYRPGSSPLPRTGTLRATRPFLIDGVKVERAAVGPSPAPPTGSRAGGTMTLVPVATPVLASGVDPAAMGLLRAALEPLGLMPLSGAGAMDHVAAGIEPGAAVGARLVSGDVDITAIGTVTHVKDGVVLAFGHPLSSLGSTSLPLVAAYVHGVMPSAEISFKLASSGQSLGSFTEDRPWCLGGRLGQKPTLVETQLRVVDRDRSLSRDYQVEVIRNRLLTPMLLTTMVAGAIRSVGPPSEGTTRVRFSLEAEGLPRMERENTYAMEDEGGLLAMLLGPAALAGSATEELARILDVLQKTEFGEARLSRMNVTVELSRRRRVATLEHVSIDESTVKPGDEVQVTMTLRVANEGRVRRVASIRIPSTCPPGRVRVGVAGGRSAEWLRSRLAISDPEPESMAQMVAQMLDRPSNDELVVQLALPTVGVEARGYVFRDLPPAALEVLRSAPASRLRPLRDYVERRTKSEWVVSGYGVFSLTVEGDERDKGGRPPSPEPQPSMFEEAGAGLAGLLSNLGLSTSGGVALDYETDGEAELDTEGPPMPTWDEVQAVGEGEMGSAVGTQGTRGSAVAAQDTVGRMASVWRLSAAEELSKGSADGVAVMSSGGLTLGARASVLADVTAQCAWPIAVGPDGCVYFGTWTDGCLRKIGSDGRTSVALSTEDAAIQAVAVGENGTVFAAAVPSGTIYRMTPGEDPAELCRLGSELVWALAVSGGGILWAATGPEGKLYRVAPDGSTSVAFTAADRHITGLASGTDGTLYLATSPLGKIYAVGADGGARSICEIGNAAAQSIAVDADGNVYVGTSPDARVLRVSKDGAVEELLKARGKHVLAVGTMPGGRVYAAAGPKAKVYLIWPDGSWCELYDPKAAYVAAMATDEAGCLYLTAADTGRVVKLDLSCLRTGEFLSTVCDAEAVARWGAVRWHGSPPAGTGMRVWTRSGGTGHPDATWAEWQEISGAVSPAVTSPPGRFLQCRIELCGDGSEAPRLEALEISYLPANRAPKVVLKAPVGGEVWSGKQTIRWSGRDPDRDRLSYEVYLSVDRGGNWAKIGMPDDSEEAGNEQSAGSAEEPAKSGVGLPSKGPDFDVAGSRFSTTRREQADGGSSSFTPASAGGVDLDEDDAEDESSAMELGVEQVGIEDASEGDNGTGDEKRGGSAPAMSSSRTWDTSTVADGVYWIKVVASDRLANPMEARDGEAVSGSVTVDNTPPEVILDRRRGDADPPPQTITVFDRTTYVTSAEFRLDGGEWLAAAPVDGIFDAQLEALVLDQTRLPTGAHSLEVRGRDAAGNWASAVLHYER